jgi:hypothetical protein
MAMSEQLIDFAPQKFAMEYRLAFRSTDLSRSAQKRNSPEKVTPI